MNPNNHRYPIDYKSIIVEENENDASPKTLNNRKFVKEQLYIFIGEHYDEIINLCNNKYHDSLETLLDTFKYANSHLHDSPTLFDQCTDQIFAHCIKNDNIEHFRIVTQCYSAREVYVYFSDIIEVISEHNNPIPFFSILIENNLKIHPACIKWAITNGYTKFISYLVDIKYDISRGYQMVISWLKSSYHMNNKLNVNILKLLMDSGIDISTDSTVIMKNAIFIENQNVIEFMVESFSDKININEPLDFCCQTHNVNALIYFLKHGADIHIMGINVLYNTSIDILKVLIDNNYPVPPESLKILLINHFAEDTDLNNINYLLKNGAQIQWIFDDEKKGENMLFYNYIVGKKLYSILEYVITKGEFYKIKFLADNYLNLLKPELNRLFVLVCKWTK